jgi:hypothetical protein
MPIRINLLAEAQALEDLRRRDPVKRSIWAAGILICTMLTWSGYMQLKAMKIKSDVNRIQAQVTRHANEFQQALGNQRRLDEVTHRLASLHQLATNRLLYGTLLDALQSSTIDDVQLTRFRTEQSFSMTEEVRPKTNDEGHVTPGRPATASEKIVVVLDARDSGPNPGDQVNKYKKAIADYPYFGAILGKTNEVRLTSLAPPQMIDGKSCVQFTLECRYPERTR